MLRNQISKTVATGLTLKNVFSSRHVNTRHVSGSVVIICSSLTFDDGCFCGRAQTGNVRALAFNKYQEEVSHQAVPTEQPHEGSTGNASHGNRDDRNLIDVARRGLSQRSNRPPGRDQRSAHLLLLRNPSMLWRRSVRP